MPLIIIELPQVGESVTEGVITKWLVQPGEKVRKFDPLVEVMTDKVNMEVPSPYSGTLMKTLAAEGDTIPMGEPIAEMYVEGDVPTTNGASIRDPSLSMGEGEGGAPAFEPRSPEPTPTFEFIDSVRSVGPTGSGEGGQGRPDALQDATLAARPGAAVRLSPIVKRLVAQHGVDSSKLTGTGMGGRITKEDVLRLVDENKAPSATQPAPSVADSEPTAPAHLVPVEGSSISLTPLRKTIAVHMARSAREIPAAWTMIEVDVTGLVSYRSAQRDAFERVHGVSLTYLPFGAYIIARALVANPMLNGKWADNRILLNDHVGLGVAVSTDGGLIVPVIHGAEALSVAELASRMHDLAEAARSGSLKLDDVQGGTFTLDNTGALGSVISVPIINYPQAAIVTTEAIMKRPVVVDGDAVAVRSIMNVCMTFDHRVCDGAEAGHFLADVKAGFEAINERSTLL